MAETLFCLVSTAILAIINEADQASDNKEKLQILSSLAKSIQPMLPDIQLKLQAPEMMNALSMLQTSLESVGLVIRERGGPRSKLRLPIDSVTGFAAKVQAEISGAQQSLTSTIMAIQLALQMKVLKVVEKQQGNVEELLKAHVACRYLCDQGALSWHMRLYPKRLTAFHAQCSRRKFLPIFRALAPSFHRPEEGEERARAIAGAVEGRAR